jgi:hypothetical protein
MRCEFAFLCALILTGCSAAIPAQTTQKAEGPKTLSALDGGTAKGVPAESKGTPNEKGASAPALPRSDAACDAGANTATCQTGDFNGDGKEDRIYIAAPGDFSVLNPIYENDALGEGLSTPLEYSEPAIVVELGGTTEDQAINLVGASAIQRVSSKDAKAQKIPEACSTETDKPIVLASGTSGKIMIAIDGKIISARRC